MIKIEKIIEDGIEYDVRYYDTLEIEEWYFQDKLHRISGPAVIYGDGRQYWYYHNNYVVSAEENPQKAYQQWLQLKAFD